jgi:hypothetical protein
LFSWGVRISTHSFTGSKRLRSTMTQCRSPRSKARAVSKTAAQARLYGRDVSRGEALQSWGEALQPAETQTTISILSSIQVRALRACISLRPPMRGKNISTILNRVCPLQRPTQRVRPIPQIRWQQIQLATLRKISLGGTGFALNQTQKAQQ